MTGEREQSTQGALMRPAHALHALVDYYAVCRADWPLSDVLLCAAAWYHIPSAEVVSGVALSRSDGIGYPYRWISLDGLDYDVLKMAQDRRFACHGCIAPGPDHELVDCSGSYEAFSTGFEDVEVFKKALRDIADYKLPTCPACRGRRRAHAFDQTCQSPWKVFGLATRLSDGCRQRACQGSSMEDHPWHNSPTCYRTIRLLRQAVDEDDPLQRPYPCIEREVRRARRWGQEDIMERRLF